MHVGPALVTDSEATEAAEPGERSLDNPPVPAQALTAIDPASGDAIFDPAPPQGFAAAWHVIDLVGVKLGRAPAGPTPPSPDDWRHRVDQVLEDAAVVNVGGSEPDGKRDTVGISNDVPLGSLYRRLRPDVSRGRFESEGPAAWDQTAGPLFWLRTGRRRGRPRW